MPYTVSAGAGFDSIQWAYRNSAGWMAGSANLTAANTGTSSSMARLRAANSADPSVPTPTITNIEGDNGVVAQFQFEPTEQIQFEMVVAATDFNFIGAISNQTVQTVAGATSVLMGLSNTTFSDIMLLMTRDSKSQDAGTLGATGYEHTLLLSCNISYLGNAYSFQGTDFARFQVTTNKSRFTPYGITLTAEGYGYAEATAIRYNTRNRLSFSTLIGDGTVATITTAYTPVSVATSAAHTSASGVFAVDTVSAIDTTPQGLELDGAVTSGQVSVGQYQFVNFT